MAVRVGFEPTLEQALNMISSHALSATQPPHREATRYYNSFSFIIKTARSETAAQRTAVMPDSESSPMAAFSSALTYDISLFCKFVDRPAHGTERDAASL